MFKVLLSAALCICLFNCILADENVPVNNAVDDSQLAGNGSLANPKAGYYPYGNYVYYPYEYYNWYKVYPVRFAVATCSSAYACPTQCPGTCGVWSGLGACRCNSCPTLGDICTFVNIRRGFYLHPFRFDAHKYVQCDSTPGIFYIRSCPRGLVFDARFSVCNYPSQVYAFWGKK